MKVTNQTDNKPFDFLGMATSEKQFNPQNIAKFTDFAISSQPPQPVGNKQDFLFGGISQNKPYDAYNNQANMTLLPPNTIIGTSIPTKISL